MRRGIATRVLVEHVCAGVLGVLAIALPAVLYTDWRVYPGSPLFPVVFAGVEHFSRLSLLLVVVVGGISGLWTRSRIWTLAMATVVPLPLMALLDVSVNPHSHNLLPFEFLFYLVLAVPAGLGALAGRSISQRGNTDSS
jgi:hypothetical protein